MKKQAAVFTALLLRVRKSLLIAERKLLHRAANVLAKPRAAAHVNLTSRSKCVRAGRQPVHGQPHGRLRADNRTMIETGRGHR